MCTTTPRRVLSSRVRAALSRTSPLHATRVHRRATLIRQLFNCPSVHRLPQGQGSKADLMRLLSLPEDAEMGIFSSKAEPLAAPGFGLATVDVLFGRKLTARTVGEGGVAVFHFDELFRRTLGAADYMAVAQRFHTVAIVGVPQMSSNSADAARRFITFIDEAYNNRCALLMSADKAPDELFAGTEHGALVDLEALQFEGAD